MVLVLLLLLLAVKKLLLLLHMTCVLLLLGLELLLLLLQVQRRFEAGALRGVQQLLVSMPRSCRAPSECLLRLQRLKLHPLRLRRRSITVGMGAAVLNLD